MDQGFDEPVSSIGIPRRTVGGTRIDSRLHPGESETAVMALPERRGGNSECCRGATGMTPPRHGQTQRTALRRRPAPDFHDDGHLLQPRHSPNHTREEKNKPLQVMKFGGTSVANAACILNVAKIIRKAVTKNHVVVVVSAMAGVTDKLVEAAARAQAEDGQSAAAILDDLKKKHLAAVETLIPAGGAREQLVAMIEELFESCNRLCQGTVLLRELTLRTRDAIWSLGERLSAPILAAVLAESGFASEAVGATNVVVTNNRQ